MPESNVKKERYEVRKVVGGDVYLYARWNYRKRVEHGEDGVAYTLHEYDERQLRMAHGDDLLKAGYRRARADQRELKKQARERLLGVFKKKEKIVDTITTKAVVAVDRLDREKKIPPLRELKRGKAKGRGKA